VLSEKKRDLKTIDDAKALLKARGLRPTRQRLALVRLLFSRADRHLTPRLFLNEARNAKLSVTLATIYNTLDAFADAGLVRKRIFPSRVVFDTNTTDHGHFYFEESGTFVDIPATWEPVLDQLMVPAGYEIARTDIVIAVRVQRNGASADVKRTAAD
jgi:Fur family transcriptional regulator, iron response regulator